MYAAHKHVDPRPVGTRKWMMLTPTYLTTNQSEECPWADHTRFELLLYNFSLPSPGWDTQFWGYCPTVVSFAWQNDKAILFYFTQNSVSQVWGYRSWSQLHYQFEMKISSTILINKKCHSHQQFLASKCDWGLPKLWFSNWCHPLHSDCWGAGGMNTGSKVTRKQDWPQIAEVPVKGVNFSQPRGLHLPTHRMLNSLTWYLVFGVLEKAMAPHSSTLGLENPMDGGAW